MRAQFAERTVFFFKPDMTIRKLCVWIMTWPWFRYASLLVILANSAVLGMVDYSPGASTDGRPDATKSWRNAMQNNTELFFTTVFAVEMYVCARTPWGEGIAAHPQRERH